MIELFYWPTPNGHKITIFLEEAQVPYQLKLIDIRQGQQFDPDFLAVSPNNKIPAIIDHAPIDETAPLTLFESGAILIYLAEKTKKYLPNGLKGRYETLQWLMWQVAGLGPMAGQNHHFSQYADEKIPYAIERYHKETRRLYGVLNQQLTNKTFITGEYSIADMACYPWIVPYEKQGQDLNQFPHLKRWFDAMQARPAVQKAYAIRDQINPPTEMTPEAKKILFGQDAPGRGTD